jgi:hypothetical protein
LLVAHLALASRGVYIGRREGRRADEVEHERQGSVSLDIVQTGAVERAQFVLVLRHQPRPEWRSAG